ncbi:hypothetical protein SSX86_006297 [Deinandra increscens subsp. villosa]|uniref:FAD linked oxidase N-terminal domain-containing protein n=1 Tax=Deinandra increscens subsp. villosa TaxID=3103831 RepID=A0AAP0DMF9_9ASTR
MCHVSVKFTDHSVKVEAGATLGEVYYRVREKSKTLGFPSGMFTSVGVGGHMTGGGFGSMAKSTGLQLITRLTQEFKKPHECLSNILTPNTFFIPDCTAVVLSTVSNSRVINLRFTAYKTLKLQIQCLFSPH